MIVLIACLCLFVSALLFQFAGLLSAGAIILMKKDKFYK